MLAPRPYSESFAILIASSAFSAIMIGATGPKTSSCTMHHGKAITIRYKTCAYVFTHPLADPKKNDRKT